MRRLFESDHIAPFLIAFGVLTIIASLFVPIVTLMYVQDALFLNEAVWALVRPREAYLYFGGALIGLAVICFGLSATIICITNFYWFRFSVILHSAGVFVIGILIALSVFHYQTITEDAFVESPIFSLTADTFPYSDITHAETEEIFRADGPRTKYTFYTDSGSISIVNDRRNHALRTSLQQVLESHTWPITAK
ncbi:hypothetical protein [Alteribacter natronophilus]|uniref:hypothetical protein n=1 Tax=Alteribacter natronophilus TaxID=2583810 RepID=UPI00110D7A6A|nr:hypothetical protein [Alteribacter natronophilus]TMW73935.1 hypothetical protein FGB90_06600 [Alteribacter natronophilus]